MQEANPHLSPEQARHLTAHGVNQNEDGTYSWKFDNYVRALAALRHDRARHRGLWGAHHLPDPAPLRQRELGTNPAADGRAATSRTPPSSSFERAGHWVHHDRLEAFSPR